MRCIVADGRAGDVLDRTTKLVLSATMTSMQPPFQFTITMVIAAVWAAADYFAILRLLDFLSRPMYLVIGFYAVLIGGTILWMDRMQRGQPCMWQRGWGRLVAD